MERNKKSMEKVDVRDAEPGMVLAKPVTVLGASGRDLLPEGFMLDRKRIHQLRHWGVEHIFIHLYSEEDIREELFSTSIRMLGAQAYKDAMDAVKGFVRAVAAGGGCNATTMQDVIADLQEVIIFEPGLLPLLSRIKRTGEYLFQHGVDVCVTALLIARHLNIDPQAQRPLGMAALLHDIGLIKYKREKWDGSMLTAVPDAVRSHAKIGCDMLKGMPSLETEALDAVAQHHECQDGSGYPKGLKAENISHMGAILAISEAYNTLIAPHDPKNAMDPNDAVTVILDPGGNRFDRTVLRAFVANVSLYPAGAFVRMNNGAAGVVVSSNTDKPLRPRVLILFDENDRPAKHFIANLGDARYAAWFIEKAIPSATIGEPLEHFIRL